MEVQTAADNLVELPDVLLEASTDNTVPAAQVEPVANITDASETLEDIFDEVAAQLTQPMDVTTPAVESGNIENQDPKTNNTQVIDTELPKETGTFNLGVPGLKFSSTNVKTAKDGTKMVQIHQSKITPDQLLALQNNPNIKVVFRHVPSGKSSTKPPRHLLPPGYSSPIKKRKAYFTEEEMESPDVYNFDEGEDLQGLAKRARLGGMRAKYVHGYGSGKKKGRPRPIPDSSSFSMSYGRLNLPAKVILTDLLARVNNPNAKKEVKLHTSQINAEVLANMELNPAYKIVLTTKQELPPLVIENVDAEEQAKLEQDAQEIEKQEMENAEETVKQQKANEQMGAEVDEKKNTEEPEQERQEEEQVKEPKGKEDAREKEEAHEKKPVEEKKELKKSATQTLVSRSGRIRKPSRFSLDIARLTKRKISGVSGGDSSADESEQESKTNQARKSKAQETVTSPPRAKVKEKVTSPRKEEGERTDGEEEKTMEDEEMKKTEEEEKKKEEEEEKKAEQEKKKEEEERKNEEEEKRAEEEEKKAEQEKKKEEEERKNEEEEKRKLEESGKEEEKKTEEDQETDDKTGKDSEKKEQDVTESEKEVTSTENVEKKYENDSTEGEKKDQEKDVASVEPDTSTDAGKTITNTSEKTDEVMDVDEPFSLKLTEEEEKEVIDNKFRLRKLLEQCSTEEIRSVLLPEAFDSINIGDFLLYKAGQMHNSSGKVSFSELYKEFEKLHKDASKEAIRYNTLVRRANKVGGDKRMEKIVLMPVYNIDAANSLEISNSSIDAQICGIQRTITAEMIAANSFFMKSKMNTPIIRLKFPNITAPKNVKPKQKRPLFTNQYQQPFASNQQQEPDSTTPDRPTQQKTTGYGQKIDSMKYSVSQTKSQMTAQVRRPTYIEQLKTTGKITLGGHHHQFSTKSQEKLLQNIPADATSLLRSDVQSSQMVATATAALAQLQATVDQQQAEVSTTNPIGQAIGTAETTLVSSATDTSGQPEQFFVTEDGVPVGDATSEDGEGRKQLVPIGDGQYVELPEGYSLIQTSEGYIIGQPGSTFTQGEDGNVYITNSDGTTTEITQQDVSGATDSPNIVDTVTEG